MTEGNKNQESTLRSRDDECAKILLYFIWLEDREMEGMEWIIDDISVRR
jgi:hypothetical protein